MKAASFLHNHFSETTNCFMIFNLNKSITLAGIEIDEEMVCHLNHQHNTCISNDKVPFCPPSHILDILVSEGLRLEQTIV